MSTTTTTSPASRTSGSTSCCHIYDVEFDQPKRVEIIREIDGILANEHHYVLKWDGAVSANRLLEQVRAPARLLVTRSATTTISSGSWWIDPEKSAQVTRAMSDPSLKLPVEPLENRYWQEFAKKQGAATELKETAYARSSNLDPAGVLAFSSDAGVWRALECPGATCFQWSVLNRCSGLARQEQLSGLS